MALEQNYRREKIRMGVARVWYGDPTVEGGMVHLGETTGDVVFDPGPDLVHHRLRGMATPVNTHHRGFSATARVPLGEKSVRVLRELLHGNWDGNTFSVGQSRRAGKPGARTLLIVPESEAHLGAASEYAVWLWNAFPKPGSFTFEDVSASPSGYEVEFQGQRDASKPEGFRVWTIGDPTGVGEGGGPTIDIVRDLYPPITGLKAEAISTKAVRLAWHDNSSLETGFRIERKTAGGAWGVLSLVPADSVEHVDDTCSPTTIYTYRVIAELSDGSEFPSKEVVVETPAPTEAWQVIPDIVGYFDIREGVTAPDGVIDQWDDVRVARGEAIPVPPFMPTASSRRPALHPDGYAMFDGVDDFLKSDSIGNGYWSAAIPEGSDVYALLVCRFRSIPGGYVKNVLSALGESGTNGFRRAFEIKAVSGSAQCSYSDATAFNHSGATTNIPVTSGQVRLLQVQRTSGVGVTFMEHGGSSTTNNGGRVTPAVSDSVILGGTSTNFTAIMDVFRVIIMNRLATQDEIDRFVAEAVADFGADIS